MNGDSEEISTDAKESTELIMTFQYYCFFLSFRNEHCLFFVSSVLVCETRLNKTVYVRSSVKAIDYIVLKFLEIVLSRLAVIAHKVIIVSTKNKSQSQNHNRFVSLRTN